MCDAPTPEDRDPAWDHERQLQVLRQVIDSAQRARARIEHVSFRCLGILFGFLIAAGGRLVSFTGSRRWLMTVALVAFAGLAGWATVRAARQYRNLYAALISIEQRLGFYAPGGIGLPGTALPESFQGLDRPYISLTAHYAYVAMIVLAASLGVMAVWR